MKLTGLHLLMSYKCSYECDHCFAWGSPWQEGTMTLAQIEEILRQAEEHATVEWIYFEGGEPFLFYAVLKRAVEVAALLGFRVGVVSNAYWATSEQDAVEYLRPLAGLVQDLSISSDLYHGDEVSRERSRNAMAAARRLDIPSLGLSIAQPEETDAAVARGQLPEGTSAVRYRGRAAERLSARADGRPWAEFSECPCEDFRDPGRLHVDPIGNLHICQGLTIGNLFERPLQEICRDYDPDAHPVIGPLTRGGPVELVREYQLPHEETYADACHLCYEARKALRSRFPATLGPEQMYGVPEGD